ncbi:hypothetical protein [Simplicispira psychrophila]|uniref:hypothetical protein n=1 Tax=Simplicispira psychrophila TaxID=80882 RepID=UPI000487C60C|nr:hypothetical protein [Simplicispira psychrophila]
MKRRKNSFEKWFSFSRHRRRLGAGALGAVLEQADLQALKTQLVLAADGQERVYAHGSAPDLAEHLLRLRGEFVGQPELLYRHAQLIVLIRREVDIPAHYERFEQLWLAEVSYLRTQLDLRWLVAACDTFIDHAKDPVLRAVALSAVVLVNTVKLQETERFLLGAAATSAPEQEEALQALRTRRVNLFDGLSAFIPGTDDTLRNMRWRLDDVCALHPLGAVVLEIFERLQGESHDNVYLRFKQRHTRDKTRWWQS